MKRKIVRNILLCLCFLLSRLSFAQIAPGAVVSVSQKEAEILFHMQTGMMKLEICSPSVVHVVYSPDGSFPQRDNPMVIRTGWPNTPYKTESSEREFSISTSQLRVTVGRSDGHITFRDLQNNCLLQEGDGDSGKRMTPARVNGERTYHASALFLPGPGEAFYGLGQHQAGVWNYSGESVDLSQDNTNSSMPFFVSSLGYGVFWNNSSASRFNNRFAQHLFLGSEVADAIDYYFLYGPEFDQIIAAYRTLTGAAPLFGKWAYGFWQGRNSYKSQEEILGVARKYRDLHIPIDNLVQERFWWTKTGSHLFNQNFPDPKSMVDVLHAASFHLMISVWPFFEPGTGNYDAFDHRGWFLLKDKTAANWPTGTELYDPFNPGARQLYWRMIDDTLFRQGFDAWQLDATEPETPGREENLMQHVRTSMGSGARYANIFPLMAAAAVYEGQRDRTDNQRVVTLTSSAAPGLQRNAAAVRSGDVFSTWTALKRQIPAGLNFSLSGLPYWTTDIGGSTSGHPSDPAYRELFVRWFQYGTFCPIFQVHGTRDNNQNELWSFNPETELILSRYDALRYRLLPYIYSLAWRVTNEGYTLMRPLVMDFRSDAEAREISDQFLFGPALLVNPVTDPGATSRRLYLPQGTWYDFWTGRSQTGGGYTTAYAPIETLPLYVRAGSILPMGPLLQYASEKPADPIELRIYPGADGDFTLYEDEGDSYRYESGIRAVTRLHWDEASQTLSISERAGNFPGILERRTFNIVWVKEGHGAGVTLSAQFDKTVHYSWKAVTVQRPTTEKLATKK